MDFSSVSWTLVVDVFLLLLIGIGPKIALVPFLDLTAKLDDTAKAQVVRKMITTASVTAVLLIVFGKLLTKLLHFSTGAMGIAGGIILLIISVSMVLSRSDSQTVQHDTKIDPMKLAVYPLAVPYLLNPAGIVTLITVSVEATSSLMLLAIIAVLAVVILIDIYVFRWANKVSEHLDQNRMLITEKVFGILLAALAVQLALDGLSELGIIHLTAH